MTTHSSILAWKIPGQKSLVGYSPRGYKESDMPWHAHSTCFCETRGSLLAQHIPSLLSPSVTPLMTCPVC